MENSPLGKLPAELRLRIYEYVLVIPGKIEITPHWRPIEPVPTGKLVQTCRQIHEEAIPVFYGKNKFNIMCPHSKSWFGGEINDYFLVLRNCEKWLRAIGPKNSRFISYLSIFGGSMDLDDAAGFSSDWWSAARILEAGMLCNTGLRYESLFNTILVDCQYQCEACYSDEFDDAFLVFDEEIQICHGFDAYAILNLLDSVEAYINCCHFGMEEEDMCDHLEEICTHIQALRELLLLLSRDKESCNTADQVNYLWNRKPTRAVSEEL